MHKKISGLVKTAAAAAVIATSVALAPLAHACSCGLPDSRESAELTLSSADAVFHGTVRNITVIDESRHIEFTVDSVYSGKIGNSVVVVTHRDSPTCGANFTLGQPSLVIANSHSMRKGMPVALHTNLCSQLWADILWGENGGGNFWPNGTPDWANRSLVAETLGEPYRPVPAALGSIGSVLPPGVLSFTSWPPELLAPVLAFQNLNLLGALLPQMPDTGDFGS